MRTGDFHPKWSKFGTIVQLGPKIKGEQIIKMGHFLGPRKVKSVNIWILYLYIFYVWC